MIFGDVIMCGVIVGFFEELLEKFTCLQVKQLDNNKTFCKIIFPLKFIYFSPNLFPKLSQCSGIVKVFSILFGEKNILNFIRNLILQKVYIAITKNEIIKTKKIIERRVDCFCEKQLA